MSRYIIRRLLLAIPSLLGVSLVIFFAIRLIPGDVVEAQLVENPYIDAARADAIRAELGLDKPAYIQYLVWISGVVRGDFGTSMTSGRPVTTELVQRMPITLELAILTTIMSLIVAVPAGILSAVYRSTALDYVLRVVGIIGLAAPSFWIGTMLVVFPSIWFRWTPSLTYVPITTDIGRNLTQFLIPSIALGLVLAATVMRMVRSSLLEVLRQDYIKVAFAKGLPLRLVVIRHAVKNAFIPVITLVGLQFGFLIGGTVIIERIFGLPGIGSLTLDSITRRDYTQLQANVLFFAASFLTVNLVVDLLYAWIDPRIRYS